MLAFSSAEELAKAAAREWLGALERSVPQTKYSVALSGGRIARQFFSAVVEWAKLKKILWDNIHFFWGDERCVPPSDPESNFAIAHDLLLHPLGIPDNQVHRIRGEDSPELSAKNASLDLCSFSSSSSSSAAPILDLIFLGMGEDGHVASLFPGEPEGVISNPAIYRAVTATKPPPRRITLGYSTIAAAREVWVLASGPGKKDALQQSFSPSGQTPLAHVIRLRSNTRIFSDIRL